MADYDNIYRNAYESLNQYEEELKEAFQRRADKKGKINTEDIVDLIDDVSVLFAFDCDRAKFFFSQENRNIPEGYNINALRFNEFMELFGLWLLKEADNSGQDSDRQRSHNDSHVDQQYSNNEVGIVNNPFERISPNYEHNKKLMDELFKQHKTEYKSIFFDRLFDEGQKKVYMQDCFVVLQECFYIDSVDLKEKASDKADFFQSIGSYKRLFSIAERYFIEVKEVDANNFDVREAMMSFDDCFEFLDYWFKIDNDVILVDNRQESGEGGVKQMLLDTIAKYEKMIKETNNEVEKQVLEGTIETLKKKLVELDKGEVKEKRNKDENDPQRREERKNRALKEIFDFYCSQQLNVGRSATFVKLDRISTTITLGTFKVLLKAFRLKLEHLKLIELYNKSAGQDDNLAYDEFMNLMEKIALRAEIAPEAKVHQPKPEIMKDYKPSSYKSDPTYRVFKQNEARRKEEAQHTKKKKPVYQDQTKRDAERVEEIWEHMGLYDGTHRNIMRFFNLPFNSQDKQDFRIIPGSLKYKYKEHENEGKTSQEVQQELQKRNELRQLVKNLKSMEKGVLTKFRGSSSPVRNDTSAEVGNTYIQKRTNKVKHSGSLPKKLTMKKIENLNQKEVKAPDDRFNPYDLIDDNDDDDNMYLAEYNIQRERHEARSHNEVEKKKIDEYGKLKKAKGIAVNGRYGSGTPDVSPIHNNHNNGYDYPNARGYAQHPPQGSPIHQYESPRNMPYSGRNRIPLGHQPSYLDYDGYGSRSPGGHNYNNYNGSPSNIAHNSGYSGYNGANEPYVRNNGYYMGSKSPAYGSAIERAGRVEVDSRKREQQMINNVMNIQNNLLKKGLKIAGK